MNQREARFRTLRSSLVEGLCVGVSLVTLSALGAEPARNLTVQAASPSVQKEQRIALVIGNSAYKEGPLANPVNDARAMAKALEAAGFSVTLQTDVEYRAMLGAVRDFGNRLRQGGVGVFYYAGHGMQIKGRNYLIPIGADIQREDEVAYAALDAQAVLDKMEAAANSINLMILDACRNNPFARSFRSSTQGLAQMEAPVGTMVAFATAPGGVASDGTGANGLYTQHLLTAMRKPGLKVEDVFKEVRTGVRRDSQGKQVPWEVTSLEGNLYFYEPKPVVEVAPQVAGEKPPTAALPVLNPTPTQPALVATAPVTATPAPEKPKPASNAQGFTTGDVWHYQVIDQFKGEVTSNYTRRVGRVDRDGTWYSSDEHSVYDPFGRIRRIWTSQGSRSWTSASPGWSPGLKEGETQNFVYDYESVDAKGRIVNRIDLDEKLVGIEAVKVPAGEFQALRIDYSGSITAIGRPGVGRLHLHYWYVPELHTLIAFEQVATWNGQQTEKRREELTSFNLVNPPSGRR